MANLMATACRKAALFSFATTSAAACTSFGSYGGDPADADTEAPTRGDGSPRFDGATNDRDAHVADAGADRNAADAACTTTWLTDFEAPSALNSPPWDRFAMGTSLDLGIDLGDASADARAGRLVGTFVTGVTPAAQDYLVVVRAVPASASAEAGTRLSFEVGQLAGVAVDSELTIAQIDDAIEGDAGPQSLAIRWSRGAIVATTSRTGVATVIARFEGIRPEAMSRVVVDLVPREAIRMTVADAPTGVLDVRASGKSTKLRLGPWFHVAAPSAGVFVVKYDNVRAEQCH